MLTPVAPGVSVEPIITVGETLPGTSYVYWGLDDPAWMSLEQVRELRDDIEQRVADLARGLDSARAASA